MCNKAGLKRPGEFHARTTPGKQRFPKMGKAPNKPEQGDRLLFSLLLALTLPRATVTDRAAKSSSWTREKSSLSRFFSSAGAPLVSA